MRAGQQELRLGVRYTPRARRSQRVLRRVMKRPRYGLTIASDPEFAWYRIPKVGTRSIVQALHEANVKFITDHAYGVAIPPVLMRGIYSFAFVRDPRKRLVSAWRDKVVRKNYFQFPPEMYQSVQDFGNFVGFVETLDLETCDAHLRLQSAMYDPKRVNFVGRLESFESDFLFVCHEIGLENVRLPARNVSPPDQDPYTPDLSQRVMQLYARDIELLGY